MEKQRLQQNRSFPHIGPSTEVQYLKGVGPKLGECLRRRGLVTVCDLVEWYPRTYEYRQFVQRIADLQVDQLAILAGRVRSVRSLQLGRTGKRLYEVVVEDGSGRISCKFFRLPFRGYLERFSTGLEVQVTGRVLRYRGQIEIHHPDLEVLDPHAAWPPSSELLPIYSEVEGVAPGKLRQLIRAALDIVMAVGPEDPLPESLRRQHGLLGRDQALRQIHLPPTPLEEEVITAYLRGRSAAHRRLIFEEFFLFELHLARRRNGYQGESAPSLRAAPDLIERFAATLPFALTTAQSRVVGEILRDLEQPHPMQRLLQGDVGSGKTLVAFLAALAVVQSGYQVALMAPTEILAEQHLRNAQRYLAPMGVRLGFLTGQLSARDRREFVSALKNGDIDLAIGTHALFQDQIQYHQLGLAIIDEQHRFGVEQRARLQGKGAAHVLVMTATPIPRTLAMTVYGDLDVSVIDEMPAGRSPIVTRKAFAAQRAKVLQFVHDQVAQGHQAYFVYPLVEESEKIDLKNAVAEWERLQGEFPGKSVGLIHGRLSPEEKEQTMRAFRSGELAVLVATSVVEVGVDVPNASIMVIEHAERFGLSQLHQLRGRVGRGPHRSYCVLLLGPAVSEEGRKRAEILESTTDGFQIAEADLDMRGPGELLGTRQSGLPGFRLASLIRDGAILSEAREAAFSLVQRDPEFQSSRHPLVLS